MGKHLPRKGDSVWTREYANGIVKHIDWDSREVICFFYNSNSEESIDLHEFEYRNDRTNQWVIT